MRDLKIAWERAGLLRERDKWLGRIVKASRRVLSSSLRGIYLLGSAAEGKLTASSDIDVLIVASFPRRRRVETRIRIMEEAGLPLLHPFELHLVDEEEAVAFLRHAGKKVRLG